MAELLASAAKNRVVSYFKVVEVIAETTAPLTPLEDLLAKIPSQRADTYPPKVCLFFLLLTFSNQRNFDPFFPSRTEKSSSPLRNFDMRSLSC